MTVLSKLNLPAHDGKFSRLAMASSTGCLLFWAYLLIKRQTKPSPDQQILFIDKKASKSKKKRVDLSVTLKHLGVILRSIMTYKDVALTCGITLGLMMRTLLDLWNIQISTKVGSLLIHNFKISQSAI